RFLIEGPEQNPVELLCREKVMAKRLFDDDAGMLGAAGLGQLLDHKLEQHRGDREVVRRPLRGADLFAQGLKGRRVLVVAIDIAQQAAQLVESRGMESPVLLDAVA